MRSNDRSRFDPSIYEQQFFAIQAALMEPNLLRQHFGTFSTAIPDTSGHYLLHSYATKFTGYTAPGRLEQRSVVGAPRMIRGETFAGIDANAFATLVDTNGVSY